MKRLESYGSEASRAPGDRSSILLAVFVRLCLVCHNALTAWRVWEEYERDDRYWLLLLGNVLILLEGLIIIVRRKGVEYSWWCPCFLVYLLVTLPGIWLLQLAQTDATVVVTVVNNTQNCRVPGVPPPSNNDVTTEAMTVKSTLQLDNDIWVIIIQEALVYLLILGRWMLPRGKVTRDFLADLLLEFLAIASDIMELLAIFDDDGIRGNVDLTYTILAVWSVSFIQFVPILMQKRRFKKTRTVKAISINRMCGDKFVEIVVNCMSIFLQDGPFLALRLYIMIYVGLVTYSLIFFVIKNIVTLMLLFYRLLIICHNLPCRKGSDDDLVRSPSGRVGVPMSFLFGSRGHDKYGDAYNRQEPSELNNKHGDLNRTPSARFDRPVSPKFANRDRANHDDAFYGRDQPEFTNKHDDLERAPPGRFEQHTPPRPRNRGQADHDGDFYGREHPQFTNRNHDARPTDPFSAINPNYRHADQAHVNNGYESDDPIRTGYSGPRDFPPRRHAPNVSFGSDPNIQTPFARDNRASRKFDFRQWQQDSY